MGPFTYVTVEWPGGNVTARVSGVSHLQPKDKVKVEFAGEDLLFFDRATEKRIDMES